MPTVVQDVSGDSALQTAIAALKAKIEGAEESSDIAQAVSQINTALGNKQDKLTFDNTPTAGSTKPVTSGGIKTALDGKQNTLTFDNTPTAESTKPVTSGGVKEALDDMYSEISDRITAAEEDIDIRGGAIYESASGSLVEITDGGDNLPMKSAVVTMEPIQDLHGYDSPWPGGSRANKWDEEYLHGAYSASGSFTQSDNYISSKNKIAVDPNNSYYLYKPFTSQLFICEYDQNGEFLRRVDKGNPTSPGVELSFSSDAYFINFTVGGSSTPVSDYANNIAINYPAAVTTYVPYSNICPISGRTGLSVARAGKNLFPAINGAEYSGDLLSVACNNGEYTLTIGRYPLSVNTIFPAYAVDDLLADKKSIPAGTYTFSVAVSQWTAETELQASKLKLILTDNVTGSTVAIKNGQTETLTHDCTINSISYDRSYAMPASSVTKFTVQLELGSTATDYEPYKGNTYSVKWETEAGTVYGGTFDVASGKLTTDWYSIPSNSWGVYRQNNGFVCYRSLKNPPIVGNNILCNMISKYGSFDSNNMTENIFQLPSTTIAENTIYMALDESVDISELQVIYKTPKSTEIQLTPQEVRTLLGENNIWSDGGDISVEYPADTKTYIDNKIAEAIAAAMA